MKMKVMHRTVQAFYTNDPGEIDRIMNDAEKVNLPESLYHTAADLARTVQANSREREALETTAAYIMRYAFLLAQAGELVEAPAKGGGKRGKENPA